jgi:hypothetical protein
MVARVSLSPLSPPFFITKQSLGRAFDIGAKLIENVSNQTNFPGVLIFVEIATEFRRIYLCILR